jgi:hypothetical protein
MNLTYPLENTTEIYSLQLLLMYLAKNSETGVTTSEIFTGINRRYFYHSRFAV